MHSSGSGKARRGEAKECTQHSAPQSPPSSFRADRNMTLNLSWSLTEMYTESAQTLLFNDSEYLSFLLFLFFFLSVARERERDEHMWPFSVVSRDVLTSPMPINPFDIKKKKVVTFRLGWCCCCCCCWNCWMTIRSVAETTGSSRPTLSIALTWGCCCCCCCCCWCLGLCQANNKPHY